MGEEAETVRVRLYAGLDPEAVLATVRPVEDVGHVRMWGAEIVGMVSGTASVLGPGATADELDDFAVRTFAVEPREGEGLGLRVAPDAEGRGRGGGDFE